MSEIQLDGEITSRLDDQSLWALFHAWLKVNELTFHGWVATCTDEDTSLSGTMTLPLPNAPAKFPDVQRIKDGGA